MCISYVTIIVFCNLKITLKLNEYFKIFPCTIRAHTCICFYMYIIHSMYVILYIKYHTPCVCGLSWSYTQQHRLPKVVSFPSSHTSSNKLLSFNISCTLLSARPLFNILKFTTPCLCATYAVPLAA